LSLEEKKRRVQLMSQQGASPQVIQAYLDSLKASEQAPAPIPEAPKFDRSNPKQFVQDYEQSVRE
jgi:hypothetical protein